MKKIILFLLILTSYFSLLTSGFGQANTFFHDRVDTTIFAVADTVGHGANNYYATNTYTDFNVNKYQNGLAVNLFFKKGNTGSATLTLVTRSGTLSKKTIRKANGQTLSSGNITDSTSIILTYYNGNWRIDGLAIPAAIIPTLSQVLTSGRNVDATGIINDNSGNGSIYFNQKYLTQSNGIGDVIRLNWYTSALYAYGIAAPVMYWDSLLFNKKVARYNQNLGTEINSIGARAIPDINWVDSIMALMHSSQWIQGNGFIHYDSLVGIGTKTATPTSKLQVIGQIECGDGINGNVFISPEGTPFITSAINDATYGDGAGQQIRSASYDAFFGTAAGASAQTGTSNSYFGYGAGQNGVSVTSVSAFGTLALANNTHDENASFGSSSFRFNTSGAQLCGFGTGAGQNNTTGINSSYFGYNSFLLNVTGNSNVGLGAYSGSHQGTATNNLFLVGDRDYATAQGEILKSMLYGVFGNDSNSTTLNINGSFKVTNTLEVDKAIIGGGATPGISAGTGAGTVGSPTVTVTGTNLAGTVKVISSTAPAGTNATVCTVTYSNSYSFPTGSYVVLYPANAITALLSGVTMVYVVGNQTTFVISSGSTALTGASTYLWNYHVIGN